MTNNSTFPAIHERNKQHVLMGLPFDFVSIAESAKLIEQAISSKKRCFLSTPNINFTIAAHEDDAFYQSVAVSDLSVIDGMPLVWLAKMMGLPVKERVAGSDLFQFLSDTHREKPIRVFFFGGEPGVAKQAHEQLNSYSKGMVSVGFYDPGFVSIEEMSQDQIIEQINASEADFVLVALGAKKGQAWIMNNMANLNAPVISHLGAVINFVAGSVKRAPEKWRKLGLEWLWRIKQEPNLWKRYLKDGWGLALLLLTKQLPYYFVDKKYKKSNSHENTVNWQPNNKTLLLTGCFQSTNLEKLDALINTTLLANRSQLKIDLASVSYIDSAFMARLLTLQGKLYSSGSELLILNPQQKIKRLLSLAGVLKRFKVISG
ncbi:WecB/TagA/CpsF family glycosyltransferase [Methylophaga sp.]|uniref:WecB/TagA/CpsF family glycosyltransferase n=1 Tax=Methylophaga sp. TaxID=2024840 RepID=UPI003A953D06